ncbi:MAG: hypothetical protein NTY48_00185, partial [Candidatus Diapherotrites archaeon]|nr:hypothetical protein [Candidatus Diapherotrites archaeon]
MGDTNRLINEQILKQILPLIAIFIIALFCVTVFQGSEIFAGDQKIYLMSIKLNEHKENFLTSIFNYYDQSTMTIFDETITLTQKITGTDIYTAVFSILIITNFVFFWGIFKIAYFFTKNNYFSVLILLLFLSKTMLFGTSSADHDTILIPRLIGISLGILSIGFFLEAKTKRAVVSTIFCSLFHPITGAPITLFYLVLAIKRFIAKQKNSLHALIPMIFGIAGILFIYLFSFGKSASGIFEIIDFEWKQIMLSRTAYHFFFSWPILQYIYLSIFIFSFWLILILLKRNLSKDKKEFLFSGIITTALLVIISIILVDVFSAAFFSKMQLIRSLFIATILFKIILGALIFFEIKKNGKNLLLLAGLIILAGIIVISPT